MVRNATTSFRTVLGCLLRRMRDSSKYRSTADSPTAIEKGA
jgi:hypothetical protein